MVWGTGAARRHSRSWDPDFAQHRGQAVPQPVPAVIPPTAICVRCDTVEILVEGRQLPHGWLVQDSEAICPDCARPAGSVLSGRWHRAQATIPSGFAGSRVHGCRLEHEVGLGVARIVIRAGDKPPPGRDERVQFMLDEHAVNQLIIELDVIRAQLAAARLS